MQLRVLGAVEVLADGPGGPVAVPLRSPKLRRVLAALAAAHGGVVSTDRLADLVWGDEQPVNPEASVQTLVSRLRRALRDATGQDVVLTRPPGYLLRVDRAAVDVGRFEDLVAQAGRSLAADPAAAGDLLDRALALWRGPAYAEFADEDFVRAEVVRLEELRTAAVEDRTEAHLACGSADAAVRLAEALVAAQPLRERPHAQLVRALSRCGRQAEALQVYRDHRERLAADLGLEPSAALQQLERAVLRQDPALLGPRPAGGSGVPSRAVGTPLPAEPTELVGRSALVQELQQVLSTARAVTLTGAGGVGKTRLALHLAAQVADRRSVPDGVWLVELAALPHGDMVADAVSAALQVQQRAGSRVLDRLVDYLRPKHLLLVLDNCEHVVDAAAALADAVVRACPRVTVLATSREPLGVDGEHVRPVPPLAVPPALARSAAEVAAAPAAALLLARAAAAAPFALDDRNAASVAEVCRRLDGLPLALELAASRLRSTTPGELAGLLRAGAHVLRNPRRVAEERHRTLRAVVDWSYGLLAPADRQAFDRLCVFAGGFTAASALAVAGADDDRLHALVDRSMVVVERESGATRYRLLETLRAYGRERLAPDELERCGRAHAEHFCARAAATAARLSGSTTAAAAATLTADLDELRVAHAWAVRHDLPLALRLLACLVDHVELQMPSEVFLWAEQALAAADADPAAAGAPELPVVLAVAASGARFRGDLAGAQALAERALGLLAQDDPRTRYALYVLAEVSLFEGRLADTDALADRLEQVARACGDATRTSLARCTRALVVAYGGDARAASRLAAGARRQAQAAGDLVGAAWARYVEGEALVDEAPQQALALLDGALRSAHELGDRYLRGVALVSRASVLGRWGEPDRARPAFLEVVEHWHQAGDWTHQWTTLRSVVTLLLRLDRAPSAAVLLGALTTRRSAGPVFGADAQRLADARVALTAVLDAARLEDLLAEGAALADDEVVRLACAGLQ